MKIAIILLFSLFYAFPVSAQTLRDDRYPSWEGRMRGNYTARELGIRKVSLKKKHHYRRHRHHQHVMRNVARRQENHTIRFLADAGEAIATPFKQMTAIIGGRPSGCPARAWCGCFLSNYLGLHRRDLWLARNWASVGRASSPQPGAIAVWRHHVGRVTAVANGMIRVLSGNDGHRVRERWRTAHGVIAYRML